jgi:hypothetical protein
VTAYHFDFCRLVDTYAAHRNAAEYFRAARETLDYTECHLGMAEYGPQFQREVILNHPNDLDGFDIGRFSADWATFLGFRHSRVEWQKRYAYLMPEYGLYYFATHYMNIAGDPKHYADPEPQQFLSRNHDATGIAFNFHDRIGFRTALAGLAAFTPYVVFGMLDLTMPEEDVRFARAMLDWIARNAAVVRLGRVCVEDDDVCVVSKIRDGRGCIAVLNTGAGRRTFELRLDLGTGAAVRVRPVFPTAGEAFDVADGGVFRAELASESVAFYEVNDGFDGLPPADARSFPIDVALAPDGARAWRGVFTVPDCRESLADARDPSLPRELLSFDQIGFSAFPLDLCGGRLPAAFMHRYGFRDRRFVDTWKFVPWTYGDRLWLVWRPGVRPGLHDPVPRVEVNGRAVDLYPRISARSRDPGEWTCNLFFADLTPCLRFGGENVLRVSELGVDALGAWYATGAVRDT